MREKKYEYEHEHDWRDSGPKLRGMLGPFPMELAF
jgi:hypothetical protein